MAAPDDNLREFAARLAILRQQLPPPKGAGPYVAYTDGACIGNPGYGGWAALVESNSAWELWGHLALTTNNRAEALGVLAAVEWVPAGAALVIHSDSRITVGILSNTMKARANPDIWLEINRVRGKLGELKAEWVPGHAGVPGNERADWLSRVGAANGNLNLADSLGRPAVSVSTPAVLDGMVPQDDWERNFLKSIANQLRSGRNLSAKQQAIVDRIRARG